MSTKAFHAKYKLPKAVSVSLKKSRSGGFIVVLPEYPGAMSYAENLGELVNVVNDLVLTYFRVPRKEALKADFIYLPPVPVAKSNERSGVIDEFVSFTPRFSYA
ncbi:hypothetical protein A2897_00830 [Candidatus Woesebacteria bacterium RIFCSPLOWO2_01_FULL_44_24b]|nr:MAG: hypothetical protein A2897_00830 [Candidatus Woesebacteria bacterium RIFCSPLOWO2_01_FULL_44_24b]